MNKDYKSAFIKTSEELEYDFQISNSNIIEDNGSLSDLNNLENKIKNSTMNDQNNLIQLKLKNLIEFK